MEKKERAEGKKRRETEMRWKKCGEKERKIHASLIACWSLWAEWSHGQRLTLPLLTQTQSDACSSSNFARNCITPDQMTDKKTHEKKKTSVIICVSVLQTKVRVEGILTRKRRQKSSS